MVGCSLNQLRSAGVNFNAELCGEVVSLAAAKITKAPKKYIQNSSLTNFILNFDCFHLPFLKEYIKMIDKINLLTELP